MIGKHSMAAVALATAIGGPYVVKTVNTVNEKISGATGESTHAASAPTASYGSPAPGYIVPGATGARGYAAQPYQAGGHVPQPPSALPAGFAQHSPRAIEGDPVHDLAEVLRFDVNSEWVLRRWPRVTTSLGEIEASGYRVPLVTGTLPDDLAGSLTYYFNEKHQVDRIIFHGTTGDPRKLVYLMTSRFNFQRTVGGDPSSHIYQVRWNGKPHSELKIRPARVVRADLPHRNYDIDFTLRPLD